MKKLFVISDLHLGGLQTDDPGTDFRICTRSDLVADFVKQISELETCELVINGDFIDFLAERDFEEFSLESAGKKFERILDQEQVVFATLRDFLQKGHRLVLVLGNHDLELTLPTVRIRLIHEIDPDGKGRLEFCFHGEAYRVGPDLLIEHGNRYDEWNVVNYDGLRRIASLVSRGQHGQWQEDSEFIAPPGSLLVARAMNHVKEKLRFVDILSLPEDANLALILTLQPAFRPLVLEVIARRMSAAQNRQNPNQAKPKMGHQISSGKNSPELELRRLEGEYEVPASAPQVATKISAMSTVRTAASLLALLLPLNQPDRLKTFKNLLKRAPAQDRGVDQDTSLYPKKAADLIKSAGVKFVVFGHTHGPKLAPIEGGFYINSGSWVDSIKFPELDDEAAFQTFVEDLANNRLEQLRTCRPTYVEFTLKENRVQSAFLRSFPGGATLASKDV